MSRSKVLAEIFTTVSLVLATACTTESHPQEHSSAASPTSIAAATSTTAAANSATSTSSAASATSARAGPWSEPATWVDGQVPARNSDVSVRHAVSLDDDVQVARLAVAPRGALSFSPTREVILESSGNVVIDGVLSMRPADATTTHTLKFVGVDESAFVGGGMGPMESDVGLWVVGDGQLDLVGDPRTGWSHSEAAISAGDTTITLRSPPTGWAVGDELIVTPTAPPTKVDFATAFDTARITGVDGSIVTVDRPMTHAHPLVNGMWTAEVANLTRNVRLEGTRGGRAHVWIGSSKPQTIDYTAVRYMGPRQPVDGFTENVLGRYGLHFHMAVEGSRGSEVLGTVVRDTGGHAFVPHMSHGITFRDTVSYNTIDEAYWWDLSPDTRTPGPETNDVLFDHTMAALVTTDPDFRGFRLTGFTLAQGVGNAIRDSVAVGVQGTKNAAGYGWPESSGTSTEHGVWEFSDNMAHNNAVSGIFVWQNDGLPHRVSDFALYHNGETGVTQGAYLNIFHYENGYLYGNGSTALNLQAVSAGPPHLLFDNVVFDGAGISDYLIWSYDHTADGTQAPTIVRCSVLQGSRRAAVWISDSDNDASHDQPNALSFEQSTFTTPSDVVFAPTAPAGNVVRIHSSEGTTEITKTSRGSGPSAPLSGGCTAPAQSPAPVSTPSAGSAAAIPHQR